MILGVAVVVATLSGCASSGGQQGAEASIAVAATDDIPAQSMVQALKTGLLHE